MGKEIGVFVEQEIPDNLSVQDLKNINNDLNYCLIQVKTQKKDNYKTVDDNYIFKNGDYIKLIFNKKYLSFFS